MSCPAPQRIDPMQAIASLFRHMRKPVIGQIHGYAVGGGCELAMLADIRIAASETKFGFTELRVGATVTMGGTTTSPASSVSVVPSSCSTRPN